MAKIPLNAFDYSTALVSAVITLETTDPYLPIANGDYRGIKSYACSSTGELTITLTDEARVGLSRIVPITNQVYGSGASLVRSPHLTVVSATVATGVIVYQLSRSFYDGDDTGAALQVVPTATAPTDADVCAIAIQLHYGQG